MPGKTRYPGLFQIKESQPLPQPAHKAQGIQTVLDLLDGLLRGVVDFSFHEDGVIAFDKGVEDIIHISYPRLVLPLDAVEVPGL